MQSLVRIQWCDVCGYQRRGPFEREKFLQYSYWRTVQSPPSLDGTKDQVGRSQAGHVAGHTMFSRASAAASTSGMIAPIPTRLTIGRPSHRRSR